MNVLLKKLEGANVALVQHGDSTPELLPTRYDLFKYRGGIAWGYSGSGAKNLAYSIVARLLEDKTGADLDKAASNLLENLISQLNGESEHTLSEETLVNALR